MLVYGKNVAKEVLKNKDIIKKIYISNDFSEEEILKFIDKNKFSVTSLNRDAIDKLVNNPSQGIVIDIKDYHFVNIENILKDEKSNLIVILDHIEDSGNLGAIIRTCECAGVNYIIIPNKRNASINGTVMKASSGALLNSKICEVANLRNTIEKLKNNGYWIVGTDMNGEKYTEIDYKGKIVIIIGNEGKGLKFIVRESCDFIASIPMKGKINSLNASVACGIIIYEVLKSRE